MQDIKSLTVMRDEMGKNAFGQSVRAITWDIYGEKITKAYMNTVAIQT